MQNTTTLIGCVAGRLADRLPDRLPDRSVDRSADRLAGRQNRPAPRARLWIGCLLAGSLLGGCGIGGPGAEGSAALLSGMPKCDASLLHPRIAVGAAVGLPGKMIVYVDGVMACVDDAARVEQLFTQIEGHSLGASLAQPAASPSTTPPASATAPTATR